MNAWHAAQDLISRSDCEWAHGKTIDIKNIPGMRIACAMLVRLYLTVLAENLNRLPVASSTDSRMSAYVGG